MAVPLWRTLSSAPAVEPAVLGTISLAAGSLVLGTGAPLRRGFLLPTCAALAHNAPMPLPFAPLPDPAVDRQRDHDRRCPERETLELAAAGAAQVLGADHGVTKALAKAAITMDKADLWWARLAVKTLRRDQREAAAVGED